MKRLVLAGGGNAQLLLLQALAAHRPADIEAVLVSPSRYHTYSGMLPGWISGHFALNELRVDLLPLCRAANVRLIVDRVVGMDAERRCIARSNAEHLDYDLLSLNIGGETDLSWLQALGDRLIPVRPLEHFISRWRDVAQEAEERRSCRLVVVGGGSAGVEIALAARHALTARGLDATVDLAVSAAGVLSEHALSAALRVRRLALRCGIRIHDEMAVGAEESVLLSNGERLLADGVIAATRVRPACWLQLARLSLDREGYVNVDAAHRSVSHPEVFAAGDICSRLDVKIQRSGVHAVHAGSILAHNVISSLQGKSLRSYRPRQRSLYLLAAGSRYAVASWGRWSWEGAWVWHWKRWIDRRFLRRFNPADRGTAEPEARAAGSSVADHRESSN